MVLCAAAVTAFSLSAMPTPARADDDAETAVIPALGAEAVPELEATVAEIADDALGEADLALAPADDDSGSDPGTEPVDAQEEAAPTMSVGAETASTDASGADTTLDSADTAADSTAAPTTEDDVPAAAEPPSPGTPASGATGALNVNVAVRIGSAGDNGAVTQVNTAAAPSPVVAARASEAVGQPSNATTAAPPATGPAAPGPTWYWEWDCASTPLSAVVSPIDSKSDSLPSSWTWIWNCGDNSGQYQKTTADQYQQANTNISIRISSPGDDGPVSQTNVVISAGPGPVPAPSEERPPPPAMPTSSFPAAVAASIAVTLPSLVVDARLDAFFAPPAAPAGERDTEAAWLIGTEELTSALVLDIELGLGVVAEAHDGSAAVAPVLEGLELAPRVPPPRVPSSEDGPVTAAPGPGVPVVTPATGVLQAVAPPLPAIRSEPDVAERAKPGRRWAPRAPAPEPRAPAPAPAGPSAAAAGAGGSSGGGLPIYLALPFLAAMLDLARRVALQRATWPSGPPWRIPDTPG